MTRAYSIDLRERVVASMAACFIDETWAKTNMTRTHGRAQRGKRLIAKVRLTPIGAYRRSMQLGWRRPSISRQGVR